MWPPALVSTAPFPGVWPGSWQDWVVTLAGCFFFFLKSLGWVEIKAVRNEFLSLEILNCLFFGRGWGVGSITSQNVRAFGSLASISPQVSRRLSQHLASEMITVQLSLRRWSTPGFVCSKHIIRFLRREL